MTNNGGIFGIAINAVALNTVVGIVPNITKTTTESNLKGNFSKGISNVGRAFPLYGKVKGTKLLLKSHKGLRKSSSKLLKGGRRL